MIPLNIHIENNSKLSTVMLRNIERLVCAYDASVADGWRAIIEMQCNGEDHPYFLLDVQSNRGGGNYAEVKMAMLKRFGDLAATGLDSVGTFLDRITPVLKDQPEGQEIPYADAALTKIAGLEYIEQMPKGTAEFLREHGLTSYKGAIRVPYEILVSTEEGKIDPTSGEIRIAFSGAEEWQDMFFATDILAELQQSLNELWEHDQIWLNLRGLRANHQTAMWLKLLGIREA